MWSLNVIKHHIEADSDSVDMHIDCLMKNTYKIQPLAFFIDGVENTKDNIYCNIFCLISVTSSNTSYKACMMHYNDFL